MSSMIHSARPIVKPVANIVFCCFVFLDFEKWSRTDGKHVQKQLSLLVVTVGRPSGSTRQELSMIHSAGRKCCLILKFWNGRTEGQNLWVKIVITSGRNCGRPRGSVLPSGYDGSLINYVSYHNLMHVHHISMMIKNTQNLTLTMNKADVINDPLNHPVQSHHYILKREEG